MWRRLISMIGSINVGGRARGCALERAGGQAWHGASSSSTGRALLALHPSRPRPCAPAFSNRDAAQRVCADGARRGRAWRCLSSSAEAAGAGLGGTSVGGAAAAALEAAAADAAGAGPRLTQPEGLQAAWGAFLRRLHDRGYFGEDGGAAAGGRCGRGRAGGGLMEKRCRVRRGAARPSSPGARRHAGARPHDRQTPGRLFPLFPGTRRRLRLAAT
jgi:hypothetical protein